MKKEVNECCLALCASCCPSPVRNIHCPIFLSDLLNELPGSENVVRRYDINEWLQSYGGMLLTECSCVLSQWHFVHHKPRIYTSQN